MPMQSADGTPGRGCVARAVGSHEQSGSNLVDHDHYTVAITLSDYVSYGYDSETVWFFLFTIDQFISNLSSSRQLYDLERP